MKQPVLLTPPTQLQRLKPLYDNEMRQVDQVILDLTKHQAPLIGQLTHHLIASGGKRLRPVLTLLCAKLCSYEGKRHINLAASIELIHTATLLHDDVVDESELRRGQETANTRWGNAASVLVGDFLLSRAFQLMARDGSIEVLELLADTSAILSEGEVLQLAAAGDLELSQEGYFAIIRAKTAQLFGVACQIGAVIMNDPVKAEKLFTFGQNLGLAFQIVDDALDYSASQEALGKTIGDDFREGKMTLPVLIAIAKGNDQERQFWQRTMSEKDQQEGDFEKALTYIKVHRGVEASIQIAMEFTEKARAAIAELSMIEEKQALLDLLDFATNREY